MNQLIEKIIFSVLGGIIGFIVGIFLLKLPFYMVGNSYFVILLTTIIGIFATISINEYRKEKQIKKEDEIRNETVALITHEMRTALTSTGWAIQSILKSYDNALKEGDKKMLEDLVKSIHITVMHTVNLLDVSLLDIGKLLISLESVRLEKIEELIKETVEKYKLGAEKNNVNIITEINLKKEMAVEVDTLRIRIILENLLENALQYIDTSDKKEIKTSVTNDDKNLNIVVSDSGIGIPKSEQSEIFNEFFRASNARKRLSSGSGIGLFLCEQYIKAHKGTIRFESEENKGTTFFITIPLKTNADVEEFLKKI